MVSASESFYIGVSNDTALATVCARVTQETSTMTIAPPLEPALSNDSGMAVAPPFASTHGPLLPVLRPHHFGISVPDLNAAVNWYAEMLGFALESTMTILEIPARIAFIRRDTYRIEIFEVPGAAPLPEARRAPNLDLFTHGNKHMCFEVPDVPAAVAALRSRGADIAFELVVDANPTVFIRDVCGNLIELLEPFGSDRKPQ